LAGRNSADLHSTQHQAITPEHTLCVPTDVTNPESVRALFDTTLTHFGRVDLLFNNAGIGAPAVPVDELTLEQWHAVVNTNLNGMFYCLQQAFRVMRQQHPHGGRIINNGSISATTPRPNSIAYTATKHAISGLTKAAALDGRAYSIAVGQIDVGNAATDMAERMGQGIMQAHGAVAVEPLMDVRHVADAVVHMANLPLSANVLFQTIMATNMPFVGRG
jgi:NAD(P)-dependent dehydrogenase (short-subunit alcohol dehydrogenase family)